jgi:hypothetical protein
MILLSKQKIHKIQIQISLKVQLSKVFLLEFITFFLKKSQLPPPVHITRFVDPDISRSIFAGCFCHHRDEAAF